MNRDELRPWLVNENLSDTFDQPMTIERSAGETERS
jgi:hypothetical protein